MAESASHGHAADVSEESLTGTILHDTVDESAIKYRLLARRLF